MVIGRKSDKSDNNKSKHEKTVNKGGRSTVPVAQVRVVSAWMLIILVVRVNITVMRFRQNNISKSSNYEKCSKRESNSSKGKRTRRSESKSKGESMSQSHSKSRSSVAA